MLCIVVSNRVEERKKGFYKTLFSPQLCVKIISFRKKGVLEMSRRKPSKI
jgi:hypothetical protein